MILQIHTDSVPLRVDGQGAVRVGKTRVLLDLVVSAFHQGASPEIIRQMYSTLELADIYAVIGYYLRHQEEIDSYLRERNQEAEEMRRQIEASQPDRPALRQRLLARMKQRSEMGAPSAQ